MSAEARVPDAGKAPTGIRGFDELSEGGLPRGRATLVCGGTGCGKTLFAMEFIYRGATQYNEPGVFFAFEEIEPEIIQNMRSVGFELEPLIAAGKLAIESIPIDRHEIAEAGLFDLEGLFIQIESAIKAIGAKRAVLDTIETLFSGFDNLAMLRAEFRRLLRFLKDLGVTVVATGERGEGVLTRHGLEEYVSDCVVVFEHRLYHRLSTRRMRIVKYRGSHHASDENPFLITDSGFSIVPVSEPEAQERVFDERLSSGIDDLDGLLGGGFYRGSSVLISGTAGSGKTTLGAHFAAAACRRGERAQYFSFEESPPRIMRNLRSVGIDFAPWLEQDLLRIESLRSGRDGLESHFVRMMTRVDAYRPAVVVIDPISSLELSGELSDVKSMFVRLLDHLRTQGITALVTNLTEADGSDEKTGIGISSAIDTWLLLRMIESNGERNRGLFVLKSRGMAHSNQIRELQFGAEGCRLSAVYAGESGAVMGAARLTQEAHDREREQAMQREIDLHKQVLQSLTQSFEARLALLQAEFRAKELRLSDTIADHERLLAAYGENRAAMRSSRQE